MSGRSGIQVSLVKDRPGSINWISRQKYNADPDCASTSNKAEQQTTHVHKLEEPVNYAQAILSITTITVSIVWGL
jgi:hypothetical protein